MPSELITNEYYFPSLYDWRPVPSCGTIQKVNDDDDYLQDLSIKHHKKGQVHLGVF